MSPKEFLDQVDEARVVAAIAEAESRSSGEIRVYVSHRKRDNALAHAQARFIKLGMTKTSQRNGVLIYFAPVSQQFAIVGDVGIHEKCGEPFWRQVTARMEPLLKSGRYTEAIIEAVREVGGLLERHFPKQAGDRNELSNQVIRDEPR